MQLVSSEDALPYRYSQRAGRSGNQDQLPPLHEVIKLDIEDGKPKAEVDWDATASCFINHTNGSAESTPLAGSPTQTASLSVFTPTLNHLLRETNIRALYNGSSSSRLSPDGDMLSSSSWGSGGQYSSGTSSYPSSTSSTQSFYSHRPALVTPSRNQQNLPSLTEMNLNNTPGYTSRSSLPHTYPRHHSSLGGTPSATPYFNQTNDALDITYTNAKAGLASPYTTSYSNFSSRPSYTHSSQYSSTIDPYSPTIDPYTYSNGHSWPPTLPYPSNYPNMSDTSSIGSGRRRRGNLPKHVTDILRAWFHEHLDHPYPTDEDKQMLIGRTNLTISQISNWFINARRRHWPQLKAERERTLQIQGVGYKSTLGKS